ncbi:uncharacterized protein LOC142564220 [Dermacentor variabilis]|uniref:uncharacterized protein LOC142564220 n=1 Tax=Dermacentor variabilis TaxID=34621 RepID=UPI003F5BAB6B
MSPRVVQVQQEAGPDFLNSETGAFLLLLSVVALVVGILVIFKATENSLKEYLGLITPTTSVSSALPVCSDELDLEAARPPIEDAPVEEDAQAASLLMQERAARQIQRWYRQGTSQLGPELEGARRKRVDRWAQSLRAFFSRKKINHFRAGLQKRWGRRRAGKAASEGAEDLAPLEPNEVRPAAAPGSGTTLFSACSSQNVNTHGPAAPSTSIAGSDGSRSSPLIEVVKSYSNELVALMHPSSDRLKQLPTPITFITLYCRTVERSLHSRVGALLETVNLLS